MSRKVATTYCYEKRCNTLSSGSAVPHGQSNSSASETRDFVRSCQTPILVLPDDVPAHPYAVAMEVVRLAPKAEVSIYPWKEHKDQIPQAVRQVRDFLRAQIGRASCRERV